MTLARPIILAVAIVLIALFLFLPLGSPKPDSLPSTLHTFPKGFFWGASTAAYQVEGGISNDWSAWEATKADSLAKSAPSRYPAQANQALIQQQATQPSNYLAGKADDQYNRYPEDITILKQLNLNSYRFSIEWARIEPQPGQFDQAALDHYKQLLADLHAQQIEPFVTLWHYTLPAWVAQSGGWTNRATITEFNTYVQKVVSYLGPDVRYWVTLNEPEVYALESYLAGKWTPEVRNIWTYYQVIHNLIAAHRQAYDTIKTVDPDSQVGIAKNTDYFEPYQNRLVNILATTVLSWWWNDYIANRINDKQDFVGINYYFHYRINLFHIANQNERVSDLEWELYPQGLYNVLKETAKYHKPIIVTENGLADASDSQRSWFIQQSIASLQKAMDEGVPVKGYLHWSLLDNFEWAEGFWPRFGLVQVDRATLTRTIRPSGYTYANLIKQVTP